MGGHLAATGAWVLGGADCLEKHLVGGGAQRQAKRAVTVIGIEPVVAGFQDKARSHADGLMASAGDLEIDLLLAFEQDLAVIHAPRHKHDAVGVDELLAGQTLIGLGLLFNVAIVQLGIDFGRGHPVSSTPRRGLPGLIVNGREGNSYELRAAGHERP